MNGRPAKLVRLAMTLIAIAASAGAAAADWTTLPETSSVTMYATKQGAWFNGVFESFAASIDFDVENPAAGSIKGVVQTGSFSTQDSQNDAYVGAYLNVQEFPEARFESTTIQRTADGYRASGVLELAGHRNPAMLYFAFVPGGESTGLSTHARFMGTMTINRFDYDIASDIDVNSAGKDVTVQVELDLKR